MNLASFCIPANGAYPEQGSAASIIDLICQGKWNIHNFKFQKAGETKEDAVSMFKLNVA